MAVRKVTDLECLFSMQRELVKKVGSDNTTQEYINQMALALCAEVFEAIGETPWKPWKKQQTMNREKFKRELIDCWAFLINLTIASGMSEKNLMQLFKEKFEINMRRQDEGY